VALTDHDRLDGLPAAAARAEAVGVELVPGCELSCSVETGAMHLLVYFVEPGEGPLQDELVRLQAIRDERNRRMAGQLAAVGLPVTLEEILEEAGGSGAGRPHAAAVLVSKGLASSIQDAFDRYLARGRPGYVEKERLAPARALELARASGAVTVLAHPFSLELDGPELESAVRELAGLGLDGLEAIYGAYPPAQREELAGLATRCGLVASGGSDHHGSYKPDLAVGVGRGDLAVPDEALARLQDRRGMRP
jgi:predicted metal-dependent phosphoesterase TrpH